MLIEEKSIKKESTLFRHCHFAACRLLPAACCLPTI
jgi:hypothetical protein